MQNSREAALRGLLPLVQTAQALAQKYDVVVTNPPYMGSSGMGSALSNYVKAHYPDSKSDLFAVFMERCEQLVKKNGYQAMITQHAWMFLSSFEKLRTKLLAVDIVNMAHLGARAFEEIGGEVVQTTSFVIRMSHITDYKGEYCRLIEPTSQQGKEDMFLAGENRYAADQSNFSKIPGSPVAYWVSKKMFNCFDSKTIKQFGTLAQGLITGDVNRFTRLWHEINNNFFVGSATSSLDVIAHGGKWIPYNKGGAYRKWCGNDEYVVNWENDGFEIKHFVDEKGKLRSRPQGADHYFKEVITWSKITSAKTSFRHKTQGQISSEAGMTIIAPHEYESYILSFCNSCVAESILKIVSPTLNCELGDIGCLPIRVRNENVPQINGYTLKCEDVSKKDWDSYETSWAFKRNPLV